MKPVVQVASKLGDSLSTTFATALATKVLQSRDNLHVAEPKILSMDSSAQTAFLQQCMQAPSVDNRIEDLVKDWPEMLQQVLPSPLANVKHILSVCMSMCIPRLPALPLASLLKLQLGSTELIHIETLLSSAIPTEISQMYSHDHDTTPSQRAGLLQLAHQQHQIPHPLWPNQQLPPVPPAHLLILARHQILNSGPRLWTG